MNQQEGGQKESAESSSAQSTNQTEPGPSTSLESMDQLKTGLCDHSATNFYELIFKVRAMNKEAAKAKEKAKREDTKRKVQPRQEKFKKEDTTRKVQPLAINGVRNQFPRQEFLKTHRESLPIYALKEDFIDTILKNQIVIVVGATGSGKSTQLPQFMYESGFSRTGKIITTQPRRIAAKSIARRVADEVGTALGDQVGYKVRFETCSSNHTSIVYMTDGMLVQEFSGEPNIYNYSVVMVDEAHERSVHTDVLFGLLKQVIEKRKNLKIIVTSATLDADKFSRFFGNAPIIDIPGRNFPVEIIYSSRTDPDYFLASIKKVQDIHLHEDPGDILLFFMGQDDIEAACEMIEDWITGQKLVNKNVKDLNVLPCYGNLPPELQQNIFQITPPNSRKVVIATNIAETSLTIDGIVYVVDPGFVKQCEYNPATGIETLVMVDITKAQAIQRAGRAARTAPGKVYRLYTEEKYEEMLPTAIPDIQRSNIESVVLKLCSYGIQDIPNFEFMDPPPLELIESALSHLVELEALDAPNEMTLLGRRMAAFPVDPPLAKVLIKSAQLSCAEEVLIIVSILSVGSYNLFFRPKRRRKEADTKKREFDQPEGDHFTLLKVYKEWQKNHFSYRWCEQNFVQIRVLEEAGEIREQLKAILEEHNFKVTSCKNDKSLVQQAICSGFFRKIAKKKKLGRGYKTIQCSGSEVVYLHPSSALFSIMPEWVLYNEIIKTSKPYMREVMAIDPAWIRIHTPKFFAKIRDSLALVTEETDRSAP